MSGKCKTCTYWDNKDESMGCCILNPDAHLCGEGFGCNNYKLLKNVEHKDKIQKILYSLRYAMLGG